MAEGIFVKVMASLEVASFAAAINKAKTMMSDAGRDMSKSWDGAAAAAERANAAVLKSEKDIEAAAQKRIESEEKLELAVTRRSDAENAANASELSRMREIEAANLNLEKVMASLHAERIRELEDEARKNEAFADAELQAVMHSEEAKTAVVQREIAARVAMYEEAAAKQTALADKLRIQDEYAVTSAENRQANANKPIPQAPTDAAILAETNARRANATATQDQIDKTQAHTDAVKANQDTQAAAVASANQRTAAVTAGAVGGASTLALGGIVAEGAKIASQVEQNMNQLVVKSQEGTGAIKGMTQQVYELATQVPFSAQKLSEGLELVEQHGYRGQDAINAIKVGAMAATATGGQLADTLGGLTTQLDDMGYQGKKGPELLKDMDTMASQLVVSMKDLKNLDPATLFQSLHSVEPTAKAYMSGLPGNVASAQVMAGMDILSQTGMSQEQSAPNLSRLINTLGAVKPDSNTYKGLGQLGLKQEDLAQTMQNKGFPEVIQQIQGAIDKRTNKDTGLVDMGWQFSNPQLTDLENEDQKGLSAGGQEFLKNHPEIMKGLGQNFLLTKKLAETGLSGEESQDILSLSGWEKQSHGLDPNVKKGGTADLTKGQVYQMLFGTGDVARTGLILGQDPQGLQQKSEDISQKGTPGAFQAAYDQAMQSASNKWKELGTTLGSLIGRLGVDMLPTLKRVTDGFKDLFDFLGKHKILGDALLHALEAVTAAFIASKIIDAVHKMADSFRSLGGSATDSGKVLTSSTATAGTELKAGAAGMTVKEAEAGNQLDTAAAAASVELKAGAAELSAKEAVAGGELQAGAATAGGIMKTGAEAFSAVALALAFNTAQNDYVNSHPDKYPGAAQVQQAHGQGMGPYSNAIQNELDISTGKKPAPPNYPQGPGTFTPPTWVDGQGWVYAPGTGPQQKTVTPVGPGSNDTDAMPPDAPDNSGDASSGDESGGGKGKATATGPNIDAPLPYHPIDTNPADTPGNESYSEWIDGQKKIQSAQNEVDSSNAELAKATAHKTELINKGAASQDDWNNVTTEIAAATLKQQEAIQNLTVAKNEEIDNADKTKSGKGGEDDNPFKGIGSKLSIPNLVRFGTTFLAELAFGNPYGKLQKEKKGEDPNNPLYVHDVNGQIVGADGRVQSVTGLGGFGTGGPDGLTPPDMSNLPDAHGAHPQIAVLTALAKQFGIPITAGRDDHKEDQGYHPLGEAGDFGNGDKTPQETAFANFLSQNFGGDIAELIHTGPGTRTNIKNGQNTPVIDQPGSIYNTGQAGYHGDHDHVAITDAQAPAFYADLNRYFGQTTSAGSPASSPDDGSGGGDSGPPSLGTAFKDYFFGGGGKGAEGGPMNFKRAPARPSPGPFGNSAMTDLAPGDLPNVSGEVLRPNAIAGSPPNTSGTFLRQGDSYSPIGAKQWWGGQAPAGQPAGKPYQGVPYGSTNTSPGLSIQGGVLGTAETAGSLALGAATGGISTAVNAGIGAGQAIGGAAGGAGGGGGGKGGGGDVMSAELNRAAGFIGQVGGILAGIPLETFSVSGENFDPSSTLAGKIIGGIGGGDKSGPNTAGKAAAALKKDDKDDGKDKGGGDTTHNGLNVQGDLHINGTNTDDALSKLRSTQEQGALANQVQ